MPGSLVDRLTVLAGAALVIGGVAMIYVPAALILSGGMLLAGAFWRVA